MSSDVAPAGPSYRLFVDETGDHSSTHTTDIGKRYLGLMGIIMSQRAHETFAVALEEFKKKHLPYNPATPPILHRRDILDATGPFSVLRDDDRRAAFDADLLALIKRPLYTVVAVVLDKHSHGEARYRRLKHPYHWALLVMLERYCGWLKFNKLRGDLMAESRGKKEDAAFKAAYRQYATSGGQYLKRAVAHATLTTKEAKLQKKEKNVAGLQLADILAHPLTRDVLRSYGRVKDLGSPHAQAIYNMVEHRYNYRAGTGETKGYGRVLLV
jgi:hypothetical protein